MLSLLVLICVIFIPLTSNLTLAQDPPALSQKSCPSSLFGNSQEEARRQSCAVKSSQPKPQQSSQKPFPNPGHQLLIFVSFSMPEASLKGLTEEAQNHNATLIMRGLYQDSFVKTAVKIRDLGIGVDIHPELFEKHHVTVVPTFVLLEDGKPVRSLKGNVTLKFASKKLEEIP